MAVDADKNWKILCANLEARMKATGWKAKPLSIEAGLSETGVRDILKGRSKNPGTARLRKLAKLLGCSVDDLYRPLDHDSGTPPARIVNITAEFDAETLLLRVPPGSPIKDDALQVLQLYGRLPPAERQRVLFRLQHPELSADSAAGAPAMTTTNYDQLLQGMAEKTVDRLAAARQIRLTPAERLRLVADAIEEVQAIAVNTAPAGEEHEPAAPRPRARVRS